MKSLSWKMDSRERFLLYILHIYHHFHPPHNDNCVQILSHSKYIFTKISLNLSKLVLSITLLIRGIIRISSKKLMPHI